MEPTSIVVTTYNRAHLVARAVESALVQDGVHDVVVVDDGSTDNTSDVLADYGTRIRVVHQLNRGPSAARNAGAAAATGTWVGFLDDDDRLLPGWLAGLGEAAWGRPSVALACCAARYVDTDRNELTVARPRALGPAFGSRTALFLAGTFLVRSALFCEVGGYAEGLRCSEQTELGLRLTQQLVDDGLDVVTVDEPLVEVMMRPVESRHIGSPEILYQGALMVVERHADQLARDPRQLADFYSVAGVSAARLGRYAEARRLLLRAARTRPREPRRWARLAVAAAPAVGDRVWRAGRFRPPA